MITHLIMISMLAPVAIMSTARCAVENPQTPTPRELPRVDATASRQAVAIADPFTLDIRVTVAATNQVRFPRIADTLGDFEVLSHRDRFDIPVDDQTRHWTRTVELETLTTGQFEIPAIEIVVTGDGEPQRLATAPIAISVTTMLEPDSDPQAFQDLRDVIDAPTTNAIDNRWSIERWGVPIAVGLVSIAGLATIMLIRRRRPWRTPQQWAIAELGGQPSPTMEKLDGVLRFFLEAEFGFAATTLASQQIKIQLQTRNVSQAPIDSVVTFFDQAEQNRFANLPVDDDQLSRWQDELTRTIRTLADHSAETSQ